MGVKWSIEDIEFLRHRWGDLSPGKIGQRCHPPRSKGMVIMKAVSLGLKLNYRQWLPEDERLVCDQWGKIPPSKMALKWPKSESAIRHKARELGLIPKAFSKACNVKKQSIMVCKEDLEYMAAIRKAAAERKALIEYRNQCGW